MAKQKLEKIALPAGEAVLAFVDRPSTKFNEDGEYTVAVRLDPKDPKIKELMAKLKAAAEKAKADEVSENPKVKSYQLFVPFKKEEDENGNETGYIIVKAKSKAKIEYQGETKDIVIPMFDAKGKPMRAAIGRGSLLRVSAQILPIAIAATKAVGVSLRLSAVQVLKLETYNGGSADSFGFAAEDGYEAPDSAEGESTESESSDSDAAASSDF